MDKRKAREAKLGAVEHNEEAYKNFERDFETRVANGEPEEGVRRIQIIEQLRKNLDNDVLVSNMNYVSKMIDCLDEKGMIESKKGNS